MNRALVGGDADDIISAVLLCETIKKYYLKGEPKMAKYKVDDLVRAKFGGELWHILEVLAHTCIAGEAGVEAVYLVRAYEKYYPIGRMGQGQWDTSAKEKRVREMEIGYVIDDIPSDLVIG